jgi:hypothetical protein
MLLSRFHILEKINEKTLHFYRRLRIFPNAVRGAGVDLQSEPPNIHPFLPVRPRFI